MTIEEECPCSDTSNVASLRSDISSTINSSELINPMTGPCIDTNNDCACLPNEKLPAENAHASFPGQTSGKSSPINHQPQRGLFHGMPQFEPAIQCMCHAYRVNASPVQYNERNAERFYWKWPKRDFARKKDKFYELKLKRNHYRHYSKKSNNHSFQTYKPYLKSESNEGIPGKKSGDFEKAELDPPKYTDMKRDLEEISERIDIYYFDHGNSAYYRTTDSPPILATEKCAEKTDYAATRFWAEIFGTIHIGIAFITAFILQFLRFLLFSIIRPLTVGILQLFADYFIKPFLSIIFNALIQPVLILLYNIATSLRDLCEPIAEALGFFLREIATVFRALRIVEVNRTNHTTTACT